MNENDSTRASAPLGNNKPHGTSHQGAPVTLGASVLVDLCHNEGSHGQGSFERYTMAAIADELDALEWAAHGGMPAEKIRGAVARLATRVRANIAVSRALEAQAGAS